MSSAFCSLDDAFAGPVMPQKKKKSRTGSGSGREGPSGMNIEGFVPAPLENTSAMVDPDRLVQKTPPVEVLTGPASEGRVDANMVGADFFPLPGGTANAEEWQKAFMLEPTQIAGLSAGYGSRASMPSSSVSGKPTLWRDIPTSSEPPTIKTAHTGGNTTDASISQRLDTLTRQLEALTAPTPLQSTAELFLFVAIGLLLLLAIDTLLRFATAIAKSRSIPQVGGGWRSIRPRRFR